MRPKFQNLRALYRYSGLRQQQALLPNCPLLHLAIASSGPCVQTFITKSRNHLVTLTPNSDRVEKRVLVVGASASIGAAICTELTNTYSSVIGTFHSRPLRFEADNFEARQLNLCDPQSRQDFVQNVGPVDALVMLSGIISGYSLKDYTDERAADLINANLTGLCLFVRDMLPILSSQATLIFMSSIAAERGSFDPLYAASKGAIIPFAKSLATSRETDINVITLLPGPISGSTMFEEMTAENQQKHIDQAPRNRILEAKHLGTIVADLCGPHWASANGAVIRLNGGAYV